MATRIGRREALDLPAPPPLPPDASAGRRWRFRRDLTIYVAYRGGLSQRHLGEVFDLPHSRIAAILKRFAALGDYAAE
jgi:hypothetical protein